MIRAIGWESVEYCTGGCRNGEECGFAHGKNDIGGAPTFLDTQFDWGELATDLPRRDRPPDRSVAATISITHTSTTSTTNTMTMTGCDDPGGACLPCR